MRTALCTDLLKSTFKCNICSNFTNRTYRSWPNHSQGSCEWVDYDLEVLWVELKQIPIALESWLFGFRPCSGQGAVYPSRLGWTRWHTPASYLLTWCLKVHFSNFTLLEIRQFIINTKFRLESCSCNTELKMANISSWSIDAKSPNELKYGLIITTAYIVKITRLGR